MIFLLLSPVVLGAERIRMLFRKWMMKSKNEELMISQIVSYAEIFFPAVGYIKDHPSLAQRYLLTIAFITEQPSTNNLKYMQVLKVYIQVLNLFAYEECSYWPFPVSSGRWNVSYIFALELAWLWGSHYGCYSNLRIQRILELLCSSIQWSILV